MDLGLPRSTAPWTCDSECGPRTSSIGAAILTLPEMPNLGLQPDLLRQTRCNKVSHSVTCALKCGHIIARKTESQRTWKDPGVGALGHMAGSQAVPWWGSQAPRKEHASADGDSDFFFLGKGGGWAQRKGINAPRRSCLRAGKLG